MGFKSWMIFLVSMPAWAGVNVNNGNFFIAYRDFTLPTQGMNIEVTRTYNSRSNYVRGYFGVGWSSDLEGYLSFENGAIIYHEGGGGNIIKFTPVGKAKNQWQNSVYGLQTITTAKDGYVLKTASNKDISFSKQGVMLKIADRNKNFIEFVYDKGRLVLLRDNFNNQVKLSWQDVAKIPRITLIERGDLKARYSYAANGSLTKASGTDAVPYTYAYDDEYNLTRIGYADGSYKEMAYNKVRDWVTSFRDRDSSLATYSYQSDNLDPESKFGTTVTRTIPGQKEKEISRFWYEFRKRPDGSKFNYKAVTAVGRQVTETIFTECCGTPQVISQWQSDAVKSNERPEAWTVAKGGKSVTKFEYFPDGMLKAKTGPDGVVTTLTYETKHKKVASVTRAGRAIQYNYDARGNLEWVYDKAENRRLDLAYDLKGRIQSVREKSVVASKPFERQVFFRYNAAGRPIEIKERSSGGLEGVLKLSYDQEGGVGGIFNQEGRTVASEAEIESAQRVATTFQNLLELVQPAGVSLTPEGTL